MHSYATPVLLLMIPSCFLGYFSNAWAIHLVRKNKNLAEMAQIYLYCEHVGKFVLISLYLFWVTPCVLWNSGVSIPFIDYAAGYTHSAVSNCINFAQFFLVLNRYLAIAYDGRYYKRMSENRARQAFVIFVFPFVMTLYQILPKSQMIFDMNFLKFETIGVGEIILALDEMEDGSEKMDAFWKEALMLSIGEVITQQLVPYILWIIALVLDFKTYRKLKRRMKEKTSCGKTDLERKLVKQMVLNHVTSILVRILTMIYDGIFHLQKTQGNSGNGKNNPLSSFIGSTFYTLILQALQGFIVVFFMRPRKRTTSHGRRAVSPFVTNVKDLRPSSTKT